MTVELDERKNTDKLTPESPAAVENDAPPPAPPVRSRGRRGPVKLTVNLIARVMDKLEEVCDFTGESRTEAANRAIQLYALYHETVRGGGTFVIRNGNREREFHIL